eukprot:1449750-Alexandrium_andersonii.AAC.1
MLSRGSPELSGAIQSFPGVSRACMSLRSSRRPSGANPKLSGAVRGSATEHASDCKLAPALAVAGLRLQRPASLAEGRG